jgi:hypothetical protein
MKKNKLAFKLIDMGLKAETLANLTESQLRLLYKKLNEGKKEPKEQVTPITEPAKKSYKVGSEGGELPPTPKGYSMRRNPDGSMNATPNEGEMKEGKKTKSKKYNPWAICSSSVGREDKEKYERCVMDVKKSIKEGKDPINLFLEEKIVSLLEKHVQPKISKKEFINMISETETAPAKPKEKEKTEKGKPKTPFSPKPGVKPAPKAKKETNEAETAEPIVKPKTPTTKPKTPFSPKPGVKPAPKAGKKSVPSWLKWDNFGLKF